MTPTNCKNCGAPLRGNCEYCGTQYTDPQMLSKMMEVASWSSTLYDRSRISSDDFKKSLVPVKTNVWQSIISAIHAGASTFTPRI